jgi:hypothetical protein
MKYMPAYRNTENFRAFFSSYVTASISTSRVDEEFLIRDIVTHMCEIAVSDRQIENRFWDTIYPHLCMAHPSKGGSIYDADGLLASAIDIFYRDMGLQWVKWLCDDHELVEVLSV